MKRVTFHQLLPTDKELIAQIADWYLSEWKIPIDKTFQRLQTITTDPLQFQIVMMLNGTPVTTAGLYNHVNLIDKEPRFSIYKNWLALVYTIPDHRRKGYGALICNYINNYSKKLGVKEMYLYTDTAENLYLRLGWFPLERLSLGERNIVVLKKDL